MTISDFKDRIFEFIQGLNRRERYLVITAAVVVFVFLGLRLVVLPLSGQKEQLNRQLAEKREVYREIVSLAREYQAVVQKTRGDKVGLRNRQKGFTLFSFLDRLAGEAGVKPHITYMKPSTTDASSGDYQLSQVEMKLDAVSLENLASYLYRIETSNNAVFVKRLSISRRDGDAGGVDVVMQVETIKN